MKKPSPKGTSYSWILAHVGHVGEDCLTWPFGGCNGYGHLTIERKQRYAHRLMCELTRGPAPSSDHEAAHSCGRGQFGCVNPRHLSWKTKSENQHDRREHGTGNVWGGRGKLTDAQASEIRALHGTMSQKEIAALYGVSRANISLIMTGNLHANKVRGKGYSFRKDCGKWAATIRAHGKSVFLGLYETKDEARSIYLAADTRIRAGLPINREILRT